MGSNEEIVPIEESVSKPEALDEECGDSLVPSVELLSSNELPNGIDETMSVLEVAKEGLEISVLEECGSLVVEFPTLESALGPLVGGEETGNSPVVDGCVSSDYNDVFTTSCGAASESKAAAVDGSGGVEGDLGFDKVAEVNCGVNETCLEGLERKDDGGIVSDLKPAASSVEDLRYSGGDCSGNTLGESQMASREQSYSGVAMGVKEGGNLSVEGSTELVIDPNDVVKGLQIALHTSTSDLPNSSAELCNKTSSGHTDASLLGISSASSEKDNERSTLLPMHEAENLSDSVELEDPLQCCDPEMVAGSDSPIDPTSQEAAKLNGILPGSKSDYSVAIAGNSFFAYEQRGNAHIDDAEAVESNEAFSSLRRSSRDKQCFQNTPNRNHSRKGSKKASMDLLSAAVRSKRSFLHRPARVSKWGVIESLSKYIKLNTSVVDLGSGIVKNGGKSRKKDKVHVGASSHGSNSKTVNRAFSGHDSLKLKLVINDKSSIEPSPLTGTALQVNPFSGSGDNQLDLSNCIKDVTEVRITRELEYASDIKLEKSEMVQENSGVAVNSVDKDLEGTLMSVKCSNIGGSNLSDKEVQKSGGLTDDLHLNPGTSPDSEVIYVPNSQFAVKELEVHHNGGMDYFKTTQSPAENESPAMPKTRRKKGKKNDLNCQPGDSDVQNRHLSSSVIDKTEIPENYGESGTKTERFETKVKRKPKGSKPKEKSQKTNFKSKPASTPKSKLNNSRKGKTDKWKLMGKSSICENGSSDPANRKEDDPEAAGNQVSGNKTNIASRKATPGGAAKQRTQPRTAWVCCDACLKWRCIPAILADIIEETSCRWTCKDNQDKAFAHCSAPQEKSNAEINAELNISEDEDGCNVHLSGKYYSMKHSGSAVPQQSSWMIIKSNIFLHRSRQTQTLDEIMVCHCKPSRDGKLGCRDECLNRMLNIECVQGTCPCSDLCSNQQFQRQSYAKLKWFRSGKKGYGLQVLDNITEGQFLIEYVGEVLDLSAYEARQREYASKGHKHFYFMTLNGNEVIDACAKGNLGRFINHSCDPNCRTEKWMVNGEICIGLFAVRSIKKGEELTFDYNYVRVFGAAAKKCYCGSPQCRGYIGGDRLNNEVVVQSDSDEEFPEPVVVYENGEIADEVNMMSESSSLDVIEEKEDASLQNDAEILFDGKATTNKSEESLTSIGGQLHSIAEKAVHGSVFELESVDKSTLDIQQESPINRISISITSPKRSDNLSLSKWYCEHTSDSVDATFNKSATEIIGGKAVQSKGRSQMKISRPSKSGKSKESNSRSGATVEKAMVTYNKSQSTPIKLKKLVESSAKHHFETVEEKLNELLDAAGGICKRKDAFKGYLKLLVLTAASGDFNHHETIQSNTDLSMILDAILKTKSRTVLTDILNKNGLQMLHSMMKKCRGNFNMIPILRKLLKVFEFLAERNILTLEHINGDPPRPGVESFRESMLKLTEHEDRKVHQIARNFRDRWIPRPVKRFHCTEKVDRSMEFKRAPVGSRLVGSPHPWSDHVERPSESPHGLNQSLPPGHLIDSSMPEGSHFGECLTKTRGSGKRKSRWDERSDAVSPYGIKEQKTEPLQPWRREEEICDHTSSEDIHHFKEDDEMQEIEDAPPGFSCPSLGGHHPSKGSSSPVIPISQQYPGPLKCPPQVPLGYAQERYNSGLPVAYGIPLSYVQQFGTPQASTADGWVIGPGMPFRPFPPLPLRPREGREEEAPPSSFTVVVTNTTYRKSWQGYSAATNHTDRGCPATSSARLPNTTPVNPNLEHNRGPYSVERRHFNQQRWNNFKKPPWAFRRGGYGAGRNYMRRPPGVAMAAMANHQNEHPNNVNNGVEFAGNSC